MGKQDMPQRDGYYNCRLHVTQDCGSKLVRFILDRYEDELVFTNLVQEIKQLEKGWTVRTAFASIAATRGKRHRKRQCNHQLVHLRTPIRANFESGPSGSSAT